MKTDPRKTALLVMDVQVGIVARFDGWLDQLGGSQARN
jgi:hypothetical protein